MTETYLRDTLAELGIEVIHKNGRGWLIASCPFAPYRHEFGTDRNPSFFVKINEHGFSGYNCLSCHSKGNIHKLITRLAYHRQADYDKLVIRSLKRETPDRFGSWDERRSHIAEEMDPLDAEIYFRMYSNAWDEKDARSYLKQRSVTKEASELLELRFDPDSKRIMFPVYDHSHALYGFTSRTILPTNDRRPKVRDYAGLKKEQCILGEHLIDPDKPILLVEGLFALARMISIGARSIVNPVASMGSSLSNTQVNILADYAKPVYLLYDLDKAGDQGLFGVYDKTEKKFEGGGAFDKLRKHVPTFVCEYPEGKNDPDGFSYDDLLFSIKNAFNDPQM
jgi:hypothetical protein